ncbi:flavin reductase family protein [Actinosynnema sp. CA-248983]
MSTPTATRFRSAMRHLPTSVVVAAGMSEDDEPVGMLIGTFTSVSLSPLLVGFLGDQRSNTLPALLALDFWTFSVLADDDDITPEAFRLPLRERFDKVKWSTTPYNTPVIDGSVLSIHTRHHSTLPAGDHHLVLAEVLDTDVPDPRRRPMVYVDGRMAGISR